MIVASNCGRILRPPVPTMNPSQTIPFPDTAAIPRKETNSDAQQDAPSKTIVLADIFKKDVGSSALAQLDALHSLVQEEKRDDRRHGSAQSEHTSEESDEALDDYMKRFMERMTGRREEDVVVPAQPVQPVQSAPIATTIAEPRQATRAPESAVSLLQMRDLANASTRSAIDSHQRRLLHSNITVAFLPAAAASLTSSCLALFSVAVGLHWHAGSVCLLVVALALAWRFWAVSRRLLQDAPEARRVTAFAD
jgi:hypothetical protein